MKTITIENLTANPGGKVQGMVSVYDTGVDFPATVINGQRDGKTVLITGGVHSCEYAGIVSAMELAWELEPADVSGALIICHPLNRTGMEARLPEVIPMDGKNINRVFPGKMTGTVTEQLAYQQTTVFHPQADFCIDLHCGEVHDQLTPYVYYAGNAKPAVVEIAKAAAAVVDVPYMVKSTATTGAYNSAAVQGVPSILLERGCGGQWDRATVERYKEDVRNVLRHLGVLTGPLSKREHTPVNLVDLVYLDNPSAGCWFPAVDAGATVNKGDVLGVIKDYFGNVIDTYYGEYDGGIVLYRNCSLWVPAHNGIICYGKKA